MSAAMFTVTEVTHHGNHRNVRTVELEDLTPDAVRGMLASCAYIGPVSASHAGKVAAVRDALDARGVAELGWVTWSITARCSCARNGDGSVTTMLCPMHATGDPCATMAAVAGRRRRGSIVRGVCTHCGWQAGHQLAAMRAPEVTR